MFRKLAKMKLGVGSEMVKFFIYCFFPVGILFIYNRPDLQEHPWLGGKLLSEQVDTSGLLTNLPTDREQAAKFLERYRKLKDSSEARQEK